MYKYVQRTCIRIVYVCVCVCIMCICFSQRLCYVCLSCLIGNSPASNSVSLSSPLYLSSTSFGNLVRINSQRPLLTKVSVLVAVRSQEPTRTLQRGQLRLLCSKVPFRHLKQRLCVHGNVTGSIRMLQHTGHIKSRRLISTDGCDKEISNSFDVRFKYVAILPSFFEETQQPLPPSREPWFSY